MLNKIILCGGSGLLVGRYLVRRLSRDELERHVVAVDVDDLGLVLVPGRRDEQRRLRHAVAGLDGRLGQAVRGEGRGEALEGVGPQRLGAGEDHA